jgi:hypothetical protein
MCTVLQIPHIESGFSSPGCCVLHRIAFPVVSEWYQSRDAFGGFSATADSMNAMRWANDGA